MASNLNVLFADTTPERLTRACSAEPSNACRFVMEHTDNLALGKLVDWIADVPLKILWVLFVAWLVNRIVRRAIRRFGERIQGRNDNARVRRANGAQLNGFEAFPAFAARSLR